MKRPVVGSLLMLLVLFGSTAIHAARIQSVFAGVEEEGSSEERAEELCRVAASKRVRQRHSLCAEVSFVDIGVGFSHQPIPSALQAQTLRIDPHEFLRALRI